MTRVTLTVHSEIPYLQMRTFPPSGGGQERNLPWRSCPLRPAGATRSGGYQCYQLLPVFDGTGGRRQPIDLHGYIVKCYRRYRCYQQNEQVGLESLVRQSVGHQEMSGMLELECLHRLRQPPRGVTKIGLPTFNS